MIVVTGGAGFIGSNIIKALNRRGIADILVVDNLKEGKKFINLADCDIADYLDKDDFIDLIYSKELSDLKITAIFHQGACSTTTEWDGQFMMRNNYQYSVDLLHYCLENKIQFIYASSAAVYGMGTVFKEERQYESPLNVYGYSKFQFDQYVRLVAADSCSQVVGLRYFNVYGPREQHKGSMASVAFHHYNQLKDTGVVKLFQGSDGYADGEQCRDFIYIDDVVAVNLWFLDNPQQAGIFNVGTGRSEPFNAIANAVIGWYGSGKIEYIAFPEHLKDSYQSFTQADITALRNIGYEAPFLTVSAGVSSYLEWLNKNK